MRGPSRGLGDRETRQFISGEQGNKSLKKKGTGKQFWGTFNNLENQDFDVVKNTDLFQGNKGTDTLPHVRCEYNEHISTFKLVEVNYFGPGHNISKTDS